MENYGLNRLTYINEQKENSVILYDYIFEAIDLSDWNQGNIYNINSKEAQENLTTINENNFKDNFNKILKVAVNNRFYGNPEGIIKMGSGVNETEAKLIKNFYELSYSDAINKMVFLRDIDKTNISKIKELAKNQKVKLSKEEAYIKLVNKNLSEFSEDLSYMLNLSVENISNIRANAKNQFSNLNKEFMKSNISKIPESIKHKEGKIDINKVGRLIPTFFGKWVQDTNTKKYKFITSPFSDVFARIYADCIYYLFVNAITDVSLTSTTKTEKKVATANNTAPNVSTSTSKPKVKRTSGSIQEPKKRTREEIQSYLKSKGF